VLFEGITGLLYFLCHLLFDYSMIIQIRSNYYRGYPFKCYNCGRSLNEAQIGHLGRQIGSQASQSRE
jgi:hypothetical protein